MVFSSMIFLYCFLPLHMIAYFACKHRSYRDAVLLISSLLFYAWGEPIWVFLLVFSGLTDYVHALIVEKYRGSWQSKAALLSSIVLNLLILGFFKYSAFFIKNINILFRLHLPYREFALPIGISFILSDYVLRDRCLSGRGRGPKIIETSLIRFPFPPARGRSDC